MHSSSEKRKNRSTPTARCTCGLLMSETKFPGFSDRASIIDQITYIYMHGDASPALLLAFTVASWVRTCWYFTWNSAHTGTGRGYDGYCTLCRRPAGEGRPESTISTSYPTANCSELQLYTVVASRRRRGKQSTTTAPGSESKAAGHPSLC